MKRYKDQNVEEYKKKNIATKLVSWDSLERTIRKEILDKMIEIGWFKCNFFSHFIKEAESEAFYKLVQCLYRMRKDYSTLRVTIPTIDCVIDHRYRGNVYYSLIEIFNSEDLIFYDFISLYVNTLLYSKRDSFISDLNNFFQQLGVNKIITEDLIMPRQSEEIQKHIVEPTFQLLQSDSFSKINHELAEGLQAHAKKDYASFILCSINALISTLEYLATGEITQKRNTFNVTVAKLKKEGKITEKILSLLKAINSYVTIERKEKTKAHTSKEKATEQEALFVFNLVMSAIQFLILNDYGTTK